MHHSYIFFEDRLTPSGIWHQRLYQNPIEIVSVFDPNDVIEALERLQRYRQQGYYLAGYFSYELGYVLEKSLLRILPDHRRSPLLKFGVFKSYSAASLPEGSRARISALSPAWTRAGYLKRFEKIQKYIQAGDAYQVNLTFPMKGTYTGDAAGIYQFLRDRQPVHYGGIINLDAEPLITLSPELFYQRDEAHIKMKPMKGTIKRGMDEAEDQALAAELQGDPKNRAENLMIVDLLRNDLSRISKPGSVKVDDLFSVETYPSLHTMTSGVEAILRDNVSIEELLRSLFPCGSVTGAPKIRAMEIIRELEGGPRGAYCGAIGMIDPDGQSRFNVGIRTLSLIEGGGLSYSVGSGVVADSQGDLEYEECLLKAAFLTDGDFQLIETIGWDDKTGFMHLDLHLKRLAGSAFAFGFAFDDGSVREALNNCLAGLKGPHKVRMTLASDGHIETSFTPINPSPIGQAWPVSLCENRLDSRNTLLLHKTTKRDFYDEEFARVTALTGCKEVLFFNQKDQLCEGSFTNVFIVKNGKMLTPDLRSGLLPGVLREVLIANDDAREAILTRDDLISADEIWIGNSVRGLIPVRLTDDDTH
jgi:para-aminobenzoate synthetase/4-amino-4-deoxychorismate lyase